MFRPDVDAPGEVGVYVVFVDEPGVEVSLDALRDLAQALAPSGATSPDKR